MQIWYCDVWRDSNLPWKSVLNIRWKDWCWSWNSNTLATWCEEPSHWKRLWCWERLKAGGEGGDRGWEGWMVSPTQWEGVWANSGRWRRTGKPGVLQSIGLQRVRHDWATKQQQGKLVLKNRNRKIINSLLKNEHFRKWSDFLKSTIFKFLSQSKQINYLKSGQRQRHKSVSRINLQPTKCYPRK